MPAMASLDLVPVGEKIVRLHPANQPGHGNEAANKGDNGEQAKELEHVGMTHARTGGSMRISASLRLGT